MMQRARTGVKGFVFPSDTHAAKAFSAILPARREWGAGASDRGSDAPPREAGQERKSVYPCGHFAPGCMLPDRHARC